MRYEGRVFRPPSEARSLIIQATIGCAHNACVFCSMYKEKQFRARPTEDILEDIAEARSFYPFVKRIFLADGNALALSMDRLKPILESIKETYPECERIGVYGAPMDILNKSVEQLKELKRLGLGIIYLGLESGCDDVLTLMKKGVSAAAMIESAERVKAAGIDLSVTVISGLGGTVYTEAHALETGKVLSAMNPDYIGVLT
ncbi:MAG: radical SAM protein, partial [Clostridia bacterium]|nr:radical SAM protein [Clostridia bacterium]